MGGGGGGGGLGSIVGGPKIINYITIICCGKHKVHRHSPFFSVL